MKLREWMAAQDSEVIFVEHHEDIIDLEIGPFDREDFFSGAWLAVEVDETISSSLMMRNIAQVWTDDDEVVDYISERSPTIEELQAEIDRRTQQQSS